MSKTKTTDSLKAKVDKVVAIMVSFAKCGCICTPICDPDERHHSKRVSVRRRVDKLLLGIKVRSARYELIEVTQTLLSASEDTDRNALENRKCVLSKLAQRDTTRMMYPMTSSNYFNVRYPMRACVYKMRLEGM